MNGICLPIDIRVEREAETEGGGHRVGKAVEGGAVEGGAVEGGGAIEQEVRKVVEK